MIYSKAWTDRFLTYLFCTKNKCAMTFVRKYHDEVMRHEDVTEFIVGALGAFLETHPEMLALAIWEDETILYSRERGYVFTTYLRFCIKRWKNYLKKTQHLTFADDATWEILMKTKAAPLSNNIETKLANAIAFKNVWLKYTSSPNTIDQVIAMYFLDGCISFEEVKTVTGLKKTAIYARIERIKAELDKACKEV